MKDYFGSAYCINKVENIIEFYNVFFGNDILYNRDRFYKVKQF